MILIVLGLALWSAVHLFKRLAPDARFRMGDRAKAWVTVGSVAAIVLMVIGYRGADVVDLWYPPNWLRGINNLLMVFAFYLYAASGAKSWLARKIRHPQLTAVKTWAVAHLLVNGDLASIVLFGGMLVWAIATVILINRAEPNWTPAPPGPVRKEYTTIIATLVVVAIVMVIHNWLGVKPWG
jgi:uncharacterized membrane protein